MHGACTMVGMGQDICTALSGKAGKGVTVLVFTSATEILVVILSNEKDL